MAMPYAISFQLQFKSDMWTVISPQVPGLVSTGNTIPLALRDAADAIELLALATAQAIANGEQVRPIFREA